MEEISRIQDQLKRAFEGGAWHGPSVREVLDGVTAEKAAARPIASAHSIWEIVLHVSGWTDVVRRRVEGENLDEPEEGDWPAVTDTGDAAWTAALATLEERHRRLESTLADLKESRLGEAVSEGKSSAYVTLHGHIQHNAYHAGQIAVLRKG